MPNKMRRLGKEMSYFTLTGSLSTLLMLGVYLSLKGSLGYQFAYALAYVVSVVALYFANRLWVFKQGLSVITFIRFSLVYVFQYLIGAASLEVLVRIGVSETYAPVLIILV